MDVHAQTSDKIIPAVFQTLREDEKLLLIVVYKAGEQPGCVSVHILHCFTGFWKPAKKTVRQNPRVHHPHITLMCIRLGVMHSVIHQIRDYLTHFIKTSVNKKVKTTQSKLLRYDSITPIYLALICHDFTQLYEQSV